MHVGTLIPSPHVAYPTSARLAAVNNTAIQITRFSVRSILEPPPASVIISASLQPQVPVHQHPVHSQPDHPESPHHRHEKRDRPFRKELLVLIQDFLFPLLVHPSAPFPRFERDSASLRDPFVLGNRRFLV